MSGIDNFENVQDENIEELLIEAVKIRKELWNHNFVGFRNKQMTAAAWSAIATALGKPGQDLWVKDRWTKLRNTYTRKKKQLIGKTRQKRRKIMENSSFHLMTFLSDMPAVSKTSGNLDTDTNEIKKENRMSKNADVDAGNSIGENVNPQAIEYGTKNVMAPTYSASRNRKAAVNSVHQGLVEFLNTRKLKEDEFHFFGMSIADQMRNMETAMAAYVKMSVTRNIYECLYPVSSPPANYRVIPSKAS